MIYLTTTEAAELKGCSERYIRMLIFEGKIEGKKELTSNNREKLFVQLSSLTQQEQLRYYKAHGKELPDELLSKRRPKAARPHRELDEFSAEQRGEIALWIEILKDWDDYCAKSPLQKVPATEKFVQLRQKVNPELNISKGILYRKKAALKADDLAGLIDNRGSWKKGTSSIPDAAWECFLFFYLDQAQYSIEFCMELTERWLKTDAPQYLPLEDIEPSVIEMAGYLSNHQKEIRSEKMEWIYANVSCRAAIKGGNNSTEQELIALAKQVEDEDIRHCPHGRPVCIVLKKHELERMFGRVE